MPIDINNELETIENDEYLTTVRNAVHDGTAKVNAGYRADITEELATIRKGRYGIDIRMAIHDALEKLANASSAGGTGGDIIIAQPIGDTGINQLVDHQIIGTFEREDPDSPVPKYAKPEMPTPANLFRVYGSTSVSIEDEYYRNATAIAILLYQNGVEILKPTGWELINDPSEAAITYTPAETPTNQFNTTTWLNGGSGVSGLYYFQNCTGTKDAANGKLTYTLQSMSETATAYAYPYRVDPNDPSHPPYKVSVTSGLSYIFECDVTGSNASVGIYGNGDTTMTLASVQQESGSTKLRVRFVIPSGVTFVTFVFRVSGPATSGTTVTFSNISCKVDAVDQRIAVYKMHLSKADKTSSFTFFAQTPTDDRCHIEGVLFIKSDIWDPVVIDRGVINDTSFTHDPITMGSRALLYVVGAPTWYGDGCAIQVSGGTSSYDDKLHTVDYMRLSATYDIGHLPQQNEPTFTSAVPVTTGYNGTMQYYLLRFDIETADNEED